MNPIIKSRIRENAVKVISYLISFVSCVIVAVSIVGAMISLLLFNPDFMVSQAEKAQYMPKLSAEIQNEFVTMSQGFGVPEELFLTALEKEHVENRIRSNLHGIVADEYAPKEMTDFSQSLRENLNQYAREQGQEDSPQLQADIDLLITQSTDYLQQAVNSEAFSSAYRLAIPYKGMLLRGCGLLLLGALVLYALLFIMNKWKHRAIRYMTVSLVGAGLMLSVLPLAILLDGVYKRVGLMASNSMHALYLEVAQFLLWLFVMLGMVLIVVALLVGLPLAKMWKHKPIQKKRSSRDLL